MRTATDARRRHKARAPQTGEHEEASGPRSNAEEIANPEDKRSFTTLNAPKRRRDEQRLANYLARWSKRYSKVNLKDCKLFGPLVKVACPKNGPLRV